MSKREQPLLRNLQKLKSRRLQTAIFRQIRTLIIRSLTSQQAKRKNRLCPTLRRIQE